MNPFFLSLPSPKGNIKVLVCVRIPLTSIIKLIYIHHNTNEGTIVLKQTDMKDEIGFQVLLFSICNKYYIKYRIFYRAINLLSNNIIYIYHRSIF